MVSEEYIGHYGRRLEPVSCPVKRRSNLRTFHN